MSVNVNCRKCGKELRSTDDYAGWLTRCPACQTVNQFPEKPAAGVAWEDVGTVEETVEELFEVPIDISELSREVPGDAPGRATHLAGHVPNRGPGEDVAPRRQVEQEPREVCSLCGHDLEADADRAVDADGRPCHRKCHDRDRALRQLQKQAPPVDPPPGRPPELPSPGKQRSQAGEVCSLCQKPFLDKSHRVADKQGRLFHWSCFEQEMARRKPKPRETCALCSRECSNDPRRVHDTLGNAYHRRCYDDELARRAAADAPRQVCTLCGDDFSVDAARVRDTEGTLYHRSCYEQERQRRLAEAARAAAPDDRQPAGYSVESAGAFSGLAELLNEEDSLAAVDPPFGPLQAGPVSWSGGSRRSQHNPGIYLLIGFGVTVPLCVLILVAVHFATKPDETDADLASARQSEKVTDGTPAPVGGEATESGTSDSGSREHAWVPRNTPQWYEQLDPSDKQSAEARLRLGTLSAASWVCVVTAFCLLLAVYGGTLLVACNICGEEVDSGKATGIAFVMMVFCTVVQWLFGLGPGTGLVTLPMNLVVAGGLYALTLRVPFAKGLAISGVQTVLLVVCLLVMFAVFAIFLHGLGVAVAP